MKKILFILPDVNFGGAQKNIVNIANNLSKKYLCKILTVHKSKKQFEIGSKVKFDHLNSSRLRYSLFKLYMKIYNFNPNIIISSIGYINIIVILISLIIPKKIKIIIREANYLKVNLRNSKFYFINLFFYKIIYNYSFKIICTSNHMKGDLIELLGKKIEKKIIVINNFINNRKIIETIKLKERNNRKKQLIFIAAGRLHKQKGFDNLINHFVNFKYDNVLMLIIGEGSEKEKLLTLIKENKVKNIRIIKNKKNILYWLLISDYFILSSRWEGMPNVLLEALDCGTRIIDFSNLKQLEEIYLKLDKDTYIKNNFNKKIDINKLIKKQIKNNRSLLPNDFQIAKNIKKLETIINE